MRLALTASLLALASPHAAEGAAPSGAERRLEQLADAFVAARLERDPDIAYRVGLPLSERLQRRLLDRTATGERRFSDTLDRLSRRLAGIDRRRLDREHLVLRALLEEELAAYSALRVCRRRYWDVGHIGGWMADILDLAEVEPGGTPATRAASLARWSTLPASVETQIANLEAGLARGYAAPRLVVERTIAQLDAVITSPVERSPLFSPALRDPDPAFAEALKTLAAGPSRRAWQRYRVYLADVYLPRARASLGVNALPDGAACYRALARRHTTLSEPVEQLFARADAASAAGLEEAMRVGAQHYGARDAAELLKRAREDPAERYASAEEMLADARRTAAAARGASAALFLRMPSQDLAVQPYPEGRRGLGLPLRYFASGDPAVPAVTWVSDDRFAAMPRAILRSTILHEGIPGHHMVGGRMAERSAHPLTRLAYQGAFDEGWALYAEGLAREAGMPPSPAGQVLVGINRAKLALFDIAIHQQGWDRARLEQHFAARGGLGQQVDERLARVAAFPGQQLSYTAGELTIRELRAEAERRLGDRFSLPAFHEAVLRDGWVPLWFLRENVRAWIASQQGGEVSAVRRLAMGG